MAPVVIDDRNCQVSAAGQLPGSEGLGAENKHMGFPGSGHCLSYITQLSKPHVHRVNSPERFGMGGGGVSPYSTMWGNM